MRVAVYGRVGAVAALLLAIGCGDPEPSEPAPDAGAELALEPPVPEPAPGLPGLPGLPGPESESEPQPLPPTALSIDELGERIKTSDAIGVFTKLALKNDVDALVDDLRSFHENGNGRLAAMRERYEALMLKLIALLEKKEPDLAVAISRSRDELWRHLADPVRFAELTT